MARGGEDGGVICALSVGRVGTKSIKNSTFPLLLVLLVAWGRQGEIRRKRAEEKVAELRKSPNEKKKRYQVALSSA